MAGLLRVSCRATRRTALAGAVLSCSACLDGAGKAHDKGAGHTKGGHKKGGEKRKPEFVGRASLSWSELLRPDVFEVAPEYYAAQIGRSNTQPSRLELPLRSGLTGAATPIEGSAAPEPEPEPEPDAGNSIVDGGSGDSGPADVTVENGDLGPEETSLPSGPDGFESDTASSGSSGGGSSGGCTGGSPGVSWLLGLLALALTMRSRRRAL